MRTQCVQFREPSSTHQKAKDKEDIVPKNKEVECSKVVEQIKKKRASEEWRGSVIPKRKRKKQECTKSGWRRQNLVFPWWRAVKRERARRGGKVSFKTKPVLRNKLERKRGDGEEIGKAGGN